MNVFYPEGWLSGISDCKKSFTPAYLAEAQAKQTVMESTVMMCDAAHNLIVDLGGIRGIIPREEGAVGIESVNSSGVKVWATEGYLHIQMPEAGMAYIVGMSGKLHKILTLPEGETVTAMPQGAYVVRIGNQSYKLWF